MYRRGTTERRAIGNGGVLAILRQASRAGADCFEYPGHQKGRPVATLEGVQMNASRAAWIVAHGDPGELLVLHTCHNVRCINVGHLYLGTHADNVRDMHEAGRGWDGSNIPCGDDSPLSKITETDVRTIRTRYAAGESQAAIGRDYGLGQGHISRIVRRESWKHVV